MQASRFTKQYLQNKLTVIKKLTIEMAEYHIEKQHEILMRLPIASYLLSDQQFSSNQLLILVILQFSLTTKIIIIKPALSYINYV